MPAGELRRLHARAAEFGARARRPVRDPRLRSTSSAPGFARRGVPGGASAGARAAAQLPSRHEAFELYRAGGRQHARRTCRPPRSARSTTRTATRPRRWTTSPRSRRPRRASPAALPRGAATRSGPRARCSGSVLVARRDVPPGRERPAPHRRRPRPSSRRCRQRRSVPRRWPTCRLHAGHARSSTSAVLEAERRPARRGRDRRHRERRGDSDVDFDAGQDAALARRPEATGEAGLARCSSVARRPRGARNWRAPGSRPTGARPRLAIRLMDYPTAEIGLARGPPVRRRDRAVVLPARHGRDLGARGVGDRPLGRRDPRSPSWSSWSAAAGAARSARATLLAYVAFGPRDGRPRAQPARRIARDRASERRGRPRAADAVGPGRDGAHRRRARTGARALRRGARARAADRRAATARAVRRDRRAGRTGRPPAGRRPSGGSRGSRPLFADWAELAAPALAHARRPRPRSPAARSSPLAAPSRRPLPAGMRAGASGSRPGHESTCRRACCAATGTSRPARLIARDRRDRDGASAARRSRPGPTS